MATQRAATRDDWQARILGVLMFLQEHLDEDVGIERLAAVAHASPYHFHRMFRGLVGEPVAAHVRRLRLERAAMHLKTGDRSVLELALEAGYESHEAFTRAFRRTFGESPSGFRANHGLALPTSPTQIHFRAPDQGPLDFHPIDMTERTIEIRELPAFRAAFLRHVGPYEQVGPTWERLCGQAGPLGLFGPDTKMFGVSYDDPEVTPADKLRYDACIVVGEDFDTTRTEGSELGVAAFGGGRYAVTMHEGPYENLAQTYGELYGLAFGKGEHKPGTSGCLEFYLNDPSSTPPADLRTEIWTPLA